MTDNTTKFLEAVVKVQGGSVEELRRFLSESEHYVVHFPTNKLAEVLGEYGRKEGFHTVRTVSVMSDYCDSCPWRVYDTRDRGCSEQVGPYTPEWGGDALGVLGRFILRKVKEVIRRR